MCDILFYNVILIYYYFKIRKYILMSTANNLQFAVLFPAGGGLFRH